MSRIDDVFNKMAETITVAITQAIPSISFLPDIGYTVYGRTSLSVRGTTSEGNTTSAFGSFSGLICEHKLGGSFALLNYSCIGGFTPIDSGNCPCVYTVSKHSDDPETPSEPVTEICSALVSYNCAFNEFKQALKDACAACYHHIRSEHDPYTNNQHFMIISSLSEAGGYYKEYNRNSEDITRSEISTTDLSKQFYYIGNNIYYICYQLANCEYLEKHIMPLVEEAALEISKITPPQTSINPNSNSNTDSGDVAAYLNLRSKQQGILNIFQPELQKFKSLCEGFINDIYAYKELLMEYSEQQSMVNIYKTSENKMMQDIGHRGETLPIAGMNKRDMWELMGPYTEEISPEAYQAYQTWKETNTKDIDPLYASVGITEEVDKENMQFTLSEITKNEDYTEEARKVNESMKMLNELYGYEETDEDKLGYDIRIPPASDNLDWNKYTIKTNENEILASNVRKVRNTKVISDEWGNTRTEIQPNFYEHADAINRRMEELMIMLSK